MPETNSAEVNPLTREQRIHLLKIACAGDRLELALTTRPVGPTLASRLLQGSNLAPLLETGTRLVTPFLPRKLRLLLAAAQALRASSSR